MGREFESHVGHVKTCLKCKIEKPLSEFSVNKGTSDGRFTYCKLCQSKYVKDYYKNNPEKRIERISKNKILKDNKIECALIYVEAFLRANPCVDCGEDDWVVLEFDHVRGEKSFNLTQMIFGGYKLDRIIEEIEKCDVRCANCHRKVTYERGGCWRLPNSA